MPPVLEKYSPHFSTILFLCPDDTNAMRFILSLKHMPDTNKKTLVDLLNHCGAETSFNVEDATDHSAIIVDHNEVVNFKAPAFKITYLAECLNQSKIQNIADYRQDATKHIAKDVQCMDVVYFRRQSWNLVLTEAENQWFEENINSSSFDEFEPQECSSCVDIFESINSRLSKEFDDSSLRRYQEYKGIEPEKIVQNRLSSDEDSDTEAIDDQVKLNENKDKQNTDEEKHKDKHKPSSTTKSGNSKKIKDSTNLQSKAVDDKSKNGTASHSINKKNFSSRSTEIDGTSTSGPQPSKWSFLDEFQPESSDEEELQPKAAEKEKKTSRLPYSYDEQCKILNYIIEHCEYTRIKGRELWMIMEKRKICPNRTWQSMKEHFIKKIVLNLEAFDFLSHTYKMKIKSAVS